MKVKVERAEPQQEAQGFVAFCSLVNPHWSMKKKKRLDTFPLFSSQNLICGHISAVMVKCIFGNQSILF